MWLLFSIGVDRAIKIMCHKLISLALSAFVGSVTKEQFSTEVGSGALIEVAINSKDLSPLKLRVKISGMVEGMAGICFPGKNSGYRKGQCYLRSL